MITDTMPILAEQGGDRVVQDWRCLWTTSRLVCAAG
jgi:hypothetical protein